MLKSIICKVSISSKFTTSKYTLKKFFQLLLLFSFYKSLSGPHTNANLLSKTSIFKYKLKKPRLLIFFYQFCVPLIWVFDCEQALDIGEVLLEVVGREHCDLSMVEPGLDSFLQTLDHVQLSRQTDDDDWGGAGLGDVKQVVQQCLKKTNWYFYFFSKS